MVIFVEVVSLASIEYFFGVVVHIQSAAVVVAILFQINIIQGLAHDLVQIVDQPLTQVELGVTFQIIFQIVVITIDDDLELTLILPAIGILCLVIDGVLVQVTVLQQGIVSFFGQINFIGSIAVAFEVERTIFQQDLIIFIGFDLEPIDNDVFLVMVR